MLRVLGKIIEYTVLAAIVFVALLVLASVLPVPGGTKTYVVRSGSMEPAIKTGAVVVVMPRDSYKVGDVITFGQGRANETPTTHRIAEVTGQGDSASYMTKGDANEEADGVPIADRNVIGKVMLDIPYLGYAVAAAQKPAGFIALVILPALIVIVDQIQALIKEVRKGRNDSEEPEPTEDGDDDSSPVVAQKDKERLRLRKTVVRIASSPSSRKSKSKPSRKASLSTASKLT